jgi:hypothetical protein
MHVVDYSVVEFEYAQKSAVIIKNEMCINCHLVSFVCSYNSAFKYFDGSTAGKGGLIQKLHFIRFFFLSCYLITPLVSRPYSFDDRLIN